MIRLLKRLLHIDSAGVSAIKRISVHRITKVSYGHYQIHVKDTIAYYDFIYTPEDGIAELWSNNDLLYDTENAIEAMEMYLYLKGLYHDK